MTGSDCQLDRPRPARRRRRLPPAAPATWALAALNVAVFAVDRLWAPGPRRLPIERWAELSEHALWGGAWWQPVTSAFVHGDAYHLVGNLVTLLLFGHLLEPAIGARRLLVAYALTALAASLADLLLDPGCSLGASGAVFGLAGAYVALLWRDRGAWWRWGKVGRRWFWTLFTLWLIAGTWDTEGVGYLAHAGGLLAGIWYGAGLPVLGWESRRARRIRRRRQARLALALSAAAVLVAGSFWQPGWWYARAWSAARAGDWGAAQRHLFALQATANTGRYEHGYLLARAAALCVRHDDRLRARDLLAPACAAIREAWAYRTLGDLQNWEPPYLEREALGNYRMALMVDPQDARAMAGIAWLRVDAEDSTLRDPGQALEMARRAVAASDRNDPDCLHVLALAHESCGHGAAAIRCMREALRLRPRSADYRRELARLRGGPPFAAPPPAGPPFQPLPR